MQRISIAAILLTGSLLTACAPIEESHGYVPDAELIEKLRPGVHDRDSVAELLGSPSSVATFDDGTWYYISRSTERIAFLNRKVVQQDVVVVSFDEAGIVQDVERFSLEDGRQIDLVSRTTPTRGKELSLVQELFGNLGRFNDATSVVRDRVGSGGASGR